MSRFTFKLILLQCLLLLVLTGLRSQTIEGPENGILSPGEIGTDHTTCVGGDPDELTNEISGTGVNATYQWVKRIAGTAWTDIPGATSAKYDPPAGITEKTFYRRRIDQTGSTSLFSNTVEVNVGPVPAAGSISGPAGSFCASYSGRLTSTTAGNGQSIAYQWQWRNPEGLSIWQDIETDGEFSYYDVEDLTEKREYRRLTRTCGLELPSNEVLVNVFGEPLDVGLINHGGSSVICYNSLAPDFISLEDPSGGDGSYEYLWQHKNADTNNEWESAPGDNDGLIYSPGVLTKTTSYRRQVKSCTFTDQTPEKTITVTPVLTAGAIDPAKDNQWLCYEADASVLTLSSTPSGGDPGNYGYQWEQRPPGGTWEDATGTGNQTSSYRPLDLTATQEFRLKVTSCGQEDHTDPVTVNVHLQTQSGSIAMVGSTDVCYGSAFTIGSNIDASGGVNNSPTYHWQERTDPDDDGTYNSWVDITGENEATLTISSAGVDAQYRRAAQSCGPRYYSNVVTVDVSSSTMSPGSISSSRVICYNTLPGEITGAQPPGGGNGSFEYLWQYKNADTNNEWDSAPGTNDELTYTPEALIKTTSFRRRVKSCNFTDYTAAVTMTVTPVLTAGAIDPAKDGQWICHDGDASNLNLTDYPSGGDPGNYEYQWQQRTPGGTWQDAPGADNNQDNYTPTNLTTTLQFRLRVNSCEQTDYTSPVTVNVHPDVVPGEIAGPSVLCHGQEAAFTNVVSGSGGVDGGLSYKWQHRTGPDPDGSYGPWEDINSADGDNENGVLATYSVILNQNMEFRRSLYACGPREYSNVVSVLVDRPVIPAMADIEVCLNAPVTLAPVGSLPAGATYHWYLEDGGELAHAGNTFPTSFTENTTLYIKGISSGGCEGPQATVQVTVKQVPDAPEIIDGALCGPGTVELSVVEVAGYSYQWYDMNDQFLASGTTYTTPELSSTTSYKVRTTNNLGCSSEPGIATAHINTVDAPTGLQVVPSCNYLYLTAIESIDPSVVYYWQGLDSNGKSLARPATGYYRVQESGTYYIRAYSTSTNCWSVPAHIEVDTQILDSPDRIVPVDCDGPLAGNVYTAPAAYDNTEEFNYTRVYTAISEGHTIESITDPEQPKENVSIVTAFVDGLRRPIQTVGKQASPEGFDMVQSIYYDEFGRSSRQYMPYTAGDGSGDFKINPFVDQKQMLGDHFKNEDVFYGLTHYDDSPLNRVTKTMAPGNTWAGNFVGVETSYATNSLEDGVRIWRVIKPAVTYSYVDPETGETIQSEALGPEEYPDPISTEVYPAGSLYVDISRDEDGNVSKTYMDKTGLLILKKVQVADDAGDGHEGWASTYYVYDNKGKIHFTFPPQAVEMLEAANWVYSCSVMCPVVYQYTYDGRGREITKQIPASGRQYMAYDKLDRMVASQNAIQRSGAEPYWVFTKYDHHNRPVITGKYKSSDNLSQIQGLLNSGSFSTNVTSEVPSNPNVIEGKDLLLGRHEPGTEEYKAMERITVLPGFNTGSDEVVFELDEYLSINNKKGFNDGTFPAEGEDVEILETMYYDDYRFTNKDFDTSYPAFSSSTHSVTPIKYDDTKGRRTGGKVRVLGSDQWLETVWFYDDRNRVVQVRMDNKNGGEKTENMQYSFNGNLLQKHLRHTNPMADRVETTVLKKFTYDHLSRQTSVSQEINGSGVFTPLGAYQYNKLGALSKRTLGSDLESLNYDYNVRGWLTGINGHEVEHGTMKEHFFGLKLSYDHGFSVSDNSGNISGIQWKTMSSPTVRAYGYEYDRLDRLKRADYSQGQDWDISTLDFSVSNLNYDIGGNIQSLTRQGVTGGIKSEIDDLQFSYSSGSPNLLLKVTDLSLSDEGFTEKGEASVDYMYGEHGGLIIDKSRKVEEISYNHLAQAETIEMEELVDKPGELNYVKNIYDAKGNKLSEITYENDKEVSRVDFLDGFIYEDNKLKMFSHEEGRVRKTRFYFVHDYYVKDHLSNTRVTLTEDHNQSVYLATMETDTDPVEEVNLEEYEQNFFLNLDATRQAYEPANYTVNLDIDANESARLNGADPARIIGPATVLLVSPGDVIDMEVFAYYEGSLASGQSNIEGAVLAGAVAGVFGGVAGGTLEQQSIYDQFTGNPAAILVGDNGIDNSQPRAYLNYLLFDRDFNFVDAGFAQVSDMAKDNHEALNLSRAITEPGFIYIYVSNETNADFNVYFDDLRIKHNRGLMIQESHTYPFGMPISALNFAASGLEGLPGGDKFQLGWSDMGFRNYDAKIGRFYATDPMGELTQELSTHQYAANNPVSKVDYLGLTLNGVFEKFMGEGNAMERVRSFSKFIFQDQDTTKKKNDIIIDGPDYDDVIEVVFDTGGKRQKRDNVKGLNGTRGSGGTNNGGGGPTITINYALWIRLGGLPQGVGMPSDLPQNQSTLPAPVKLSGGDFIRTVSPGGRPTPLRNHNPSLVSGFESLHGNPKPDDPNWRPPMLAPEPDPDSQAPPSVEGRKQALALLGIYKAIMSTPQKVAGLASAFSQDKKDPDSDLDNPPYGETPPDPEPDVDDPDWEDILDDPDAFFLNKINTEGWPAYQTGVLGGVVNELADTWKLLRNLGYSILSAYEVCKGDQETFLGISCEKIKKGNDEMVALYQMMMKLINDGTYRQEVFDQLIRDFITDLSNINTPEGQYNMGKRTYSTATFIGGVLVPGSQGLKIIDTVGDLVNIIRKIPKRFDRSFPDFMNENMLRIDEINPATVITTPDGKPLVRVTKNPDGTSKATLVDPEIKSKIPESKHQELADAMAENKDLAKAIGDDPDLAKVREDLKDPDIDPELTDDPEFLKKMKESTCNLGG